MKSISVHVSEADYQELKSLAVTMDRPVAELIRQAMGHFLEERRRSRHSIADLEPHPSGNLLAGWTREELLEEMLER